MSKAKTHASFGGMTWPKPCARLIGIQWKMRYADDTLTKEDLLVAASVICAYGELINRDTLDREAIVGEIKANQPTEKTDEYGTDYDDN